MARWLLKSEPGSHGWRDLVREGGTEWDGVRIVGAAPPESGEARWVSVRVEPVVALPRPVTLAAMEADPRLAALPMLRRRLSVSAVHEARWRAIGDMAAR